VSVEKNIRSLISS